MPVFAALNDEFFDACVAAAELAVSLGRPERVLAPLHLAATMAPLHEPVQAGLIAVLGAAGRQARRCRCSAPSAAASPTTSASTPARRCRPPTGGC